MGLYMKYFVLKPDGLNIYAEASRRAMRAYAEAIEKEDPQLAEDLMNWVERCDPSKPEKEIWALSEDGYPSEEALKAIENFELGRGVSVEHMFDNIARIWKYANPSYDADGYFVIKEKPAGAEIILRTGGWSGNEEIVRAMKRSTGFGAFWKSSNSAGEHVYFVPVTIWESEEVISNDE